MFKWFKNYASDKSNDCLNNQHKQNSNEPKINSHSSQLTSGLSSLLNNRQEKIELPNSNENLTMEVDYSSCKQYGLSYREAKPYHTELKCSGQTALCREVLNDTYVSYPSVSDESSFVSSKKNQHEELLFRTEDERFELDVILETNMSTIRLFESLQKKMSRMSPEELAKFRLDNTLGGLSEILHIKAIQRIYNDKAKELIEGLKKNPNVAVPLVLKRLKAKDEEWRAAKRDFERIWREQTEKNYLKSLDHCSGPFKQSDIKQLKPKSLLNEIENIYHQQNNNEDLNKAHLTFKYDDKTILEDAAALIIHHVKRQTGIQKEDKQKMKQILYHFISDLMFVPRGALSDDEADDDDDDNDTANENSNQTTSKIKREKKPTRHTDTNKRRLTEVDEIPKDVPEEYKSLEDMYRLYFVDDHWYLFFRYHQILCERLHKIYKISLNAAELEHKNLKFKQNNLINQVSSEPVAEALGLKSKSDLQANDYYPTFLDIVRNLLDGNIDNTQYEDALREMFSIHAYITFTLDKVVQYCVRQLQYIVQEESCTQLQQYFHDEQKSNASGSKVDNMNLPNVIAIETAYQKKIESLLGDKKCYKLMSVSLNNNIYLQFNNHLIIIIIIICFIFKYKNSLKLTIELLDTETQESEEENEEIEIEKYSEYIDKFIKDEASIGNEITEDIKDYLLQNPVFLTRNAHYLKHKLPNIDSNTNDNSIIPFHYKILRKQPLFHYRKNSLKHARKVNFIY